MKYMRNGVEVTEAEFLAGSEGKLAELFAAGETLAGQSSAGWPMESNSCAVHPLQAKQLHDKLRRAGVPTEVTPQGRPKFTSEAHKKAVGRALGRVDYNERNNTRIPRD